MEYKQFLLPKKKFMKTVARKKKTRKVHIATSETTSLCNMFHPGGQNIDWFDVVEITSLKERLLLQEKGFLCNNCIREYKKERNQALNIASDLEDTIKKCIKESINEISNKNNKQINKKGDRNVKSNKTK